MSLYEYFVIIVNGSNLVNSPQFVLGKFGGLTVFGGLTKTGV